MDLIQISGFAITAILATIGIIKLELIKEIAKKMTSDKEKINLFSIMALILISVIPAIIGFSMPNNNTQENEIPNVQKTPPNKSDAEVALEAGRDAILISKELYDNAQENKRKNDSIFNATKPQRWVYQLGDVMDNDESILKRYAQFKNTEGICLFKDKDRFFFFKNLDHSKKELEDSLANYKSEYASFGITIIDLMELCHSKNEKLINTKSQKFGKRKNKIVIDCWTIDK